MAARLCRSSPYMTVRLLNLRQLNGVISREENNRKEYSLIQSPACPGGLVIFFHTTVAGDQLIVPGFADEIR